MTTEHSLYLFDTHALVFWANKQCISDTFIRFFDEQVEKRPVISTITDHSTNELTSYQISYTVTGIESTNLTVTAMSSDTTLIPQNILTIVQTGENYTLSIVPVMSEAGTTNITKTLTDGENFVDTVFMVTVEAVQFQISGYVGYYLDPANQPISNVALPLLGKFSYSAVTDSSGNYTLANVRPGNYTQTIEKSDETGGIALSDENECPDDILNDSMKQVEDKAYDVELKTVAQQLLRRNYATDISCF